jgi:8-amino-7-oxononanoate synthase
MNLNARWLAQLEALRNQGRLRTLQSGPGIDFASNDYLGFAKQLPKPSIEPLSASGIASRLLRGHHPIWDQVEAALAQWHGAEAALVFTSGYAANQGLLSTIIEPEDRVASDAFNHASIVDGLRLTKATRQVYRHLDLNDLEDKLRQTSSARRPGAELFIVTESLFSMDGDLAPLPELVRLAQSHAAHLIVDEAHATGCFGATGSGLIDSLGMRSSTLASVHTGGKALGVPGAYVCCSALLKQILVNRCRHFIFTTALPPIIGAWWLDALARAKGANAGRTRLHENARSFRHDLLQCDIQVPGEHYIVPVLLGEDSRAVRAATRLGQEGFDVRAIRPPTVPEGKSRLRISIHADHDVDTIRRAAAAVASAVAEAAS